MDEWRTMKPKVPSNRYCVSAEFLVWHLTKLTFQSLGVNEPAGREQTRSQISIDLLARVPHRCLCDCSPWQIADPEREEHRIHTTDDVTVLSRLQEINQNQKTDYDPATLETPPKKGEFGPPRSTCPLDFGLPIGATQRRCRRRMRGLEIA